MKQMPARFHARSGTINIKSHPTTFWRWWKEVQQSWVTCSAAKYCNTPRRAFGIYVIDPMNGEVDATRHIFQTSCCWSSVNPVS